MLRNRKPPNEANAAIASATDEANGTERKGLGRGAAETRLQAQEKQRQADDGKEHFLAVLELALETVLPQFRQKQQSVAVTLPRRRCTSMRTPCA